MTYITYQPQVDTTPLHCIISRYGNNPFNASCSKLLLFEGFSTILDKPSIFNFRHLGERQSVRMSKIKNSGLDQYGNV